MDNHDNSIRENIIKAIEAGKVNMKPRWHFVLGTVLLISGTVLAVLALLYLVSFIIFVLHQTGSWFVAGFGLHGITEFLMSFPWVIAIVAIIFIVILEILVRKYSFGYRKPLLITSLAVLLLVVVGGFVVAKTPLHRGLFDQAEQEELPFGGAFYRQFGTPHRDNVAIGIITAIDDKGTITMEDRRGQVFTVTVNDDTDYSDNNLQAGDSIVVFGSHNGSFEIAAFNIRKVDDTEPPPPPHYNTLPVY